jgi:uncharacterized protein YijF (DUF1287 family)
VASPNSNLLANSGVAGIGWLRFTSRNSAMNFRLRGILALLSFALAAYSDDQAAGAGIVQAAREQIGKTVAYDPSYRALDFPGGDVPMEAGVCTDVVIRALRVSLGMDLQKLVNEEMRQAFAEYPNNWGLKKPDRNIDHRRVPNLQTYFKRKGWALPAAKDAKAYQPGDLVTCIVPPNLPHIMVVSDRVNPLGQPLIIHNIGSGTREEDRLFEFKITGHYRIVNAQQRGPTNP